MYYIYILNALFVNTGAVNCWNYYSLVSAAICNKNNKKTLLRTGHGMK